MAKKPTLGKVETLNLQHNKRWFRKMGMLHLWMPPITICKAEKLLGTPMIQKINEDAANSRTK